MLEELARLIYNYAKMDNMCIEQFVYESLNIIIKYCNVTNYIDHLTSTYNKKVLGLYSYSRKVISINFKEIEKVINSKLLRNPFIIKDWDARVFKYSFYTNILLHEVGHILQYIKMSNDYDLETLIFLNSNLNHVSSRVLNEYEECITDNYDKNTVSMFIKSKIIGLKLAKMKMIYMNNWKLSPVERTADIDAFDISGKIADILSLKSIKDFYLLEQYKILLYGYKVDFNNLATLIYDYPAEFYLKQMGIDESTWNFIIKESAKLSDQERARLGLCVSDNYVNELSYKISEIYHRYNR